jgi:integrase
VRRAKGEGPVYRRKDGLWVARYEAAGRRKYPYRRTKKVVVGRLRGAWSPKGPELAEEAETILVGAFLDRWLPTVRETVKERTWVRHEHVVRYHLKPAIGGMLLASVGSMTVHELYRMKLEGGLSPRSVQLLHTTLY